MERSILFALPAEETMMRYLHSHEIAFLELMLKNKNDDARFLIELSRCLVEEMDDGGMCGLRFISAEESRSLGQVLAEMEFVDEDGVTVIVTLNLDNHGQLYELDIWKTDFSPSKRLPYPDNKSLGKSASD